ncbi:MAG: hypothetical protein ABJH85_10685 [Paracoccaceae bacterium]
MKTEPVAKSKPVAKTKSRRAKSTKPTFQPRSRETTVAVPEKAVLKTTTMAKTHAKPTAKAPVKPVQIAKSPKKAATSSDPSGNVKVIQPAKPPRKPSLPPAMPQARTTRSKTVQDK